MASNDASEAARPASPRKRKTEADLHSAQPPLRRSGRSRKGLGSYAESSDAEPDDLALTPPPRSPAGPRRQPKRRIAPQPVDVPEFDVPDDLLEAALAPMRPEELEEWEGWIELESDPSFFNTILQDLGVQHVKIQELFSLEGSLSLPKPVHGLIFLYQYVQEDEGAADEQADDVWFANQTTDNACATVALLNIIMNAQDVELGDKLRELKATTAHLSPPLRGWHLCNNKWIRMIHNSFARRLDLLSADLALQNKADEARRKRARVAPSRRGKWKKPASDAGYHFIAYVPVGGTVYQLDGLEKRPLAIGDYTDDWTAVARPFIETRMLQYESEQLSFNLLALCRDPLHAARESLAENIRSLARKPTSGQDSDLIVSADDPRLAEYGLSEADILEAAEKPSVSNKSSAGKDGHDDPKAVSLGDREDKEGEDGLPAQQKRLREEYDRELASAQEDGQRVAGRRQDYTLVIHRWVRMLADKGMLKELHEATVGALDQR